MWKEKKKLDWEIREIDLLRFSLDTIVENKDISKSANREEDSNKANLHQDGTESMEMNEGRWVAELEKLLFLLHLSRLALIQDLALMVVHQKVKMHVGTLTNLSFILPDAVATLVWEGRDFLSIEAQVE